MSFSATLKGSKNRLPRFDLNLGLKLVGQTNLADIVENLGNLAAGVSSFLYKRVVGEHAYAIAYIVPNQTHNLYLTHRLGFTEYKQKYPVNICQVLSPLCRKNEATLCCQYLGISNIEQKQTL